MLTIVLSACLVAEPSQCRDYRIPADNIVDPTRCVMYAQPHVAKWADENPLWEIKKYQCRPSTENDG